MEAVKPIQREKFSQLDAVDLARIIHRRRPDWDEPGIVAALARVCYILEPQDALAAALAAGLDPKNNPVALTWDKYRPPRNPAAAGTTDGTPRRRCPDHGWNYADQCPNCWGDVRTGTRPAHMVGMHLEGV